MVSGASINASGKPTILVVDDDEASRNLMRDVLEQSGYSWAVASSYDEGLARLKANGIDLVIIDIVMHPRDGITLGREIGRLYPSLPIIYTSGDVTRLERFAEEDCFPKPIRCGVMLDRIKRHLRNVSTAGELRTVRATVDEVLITVRAMAPMREAFPLVERRTTKLLPSLITEIRSNKLALSILAVTGGLLMWMGQVLKGQLASGFQAVRKVPELTEQVRLDRETINARIDSMERAAAADRQATRDDIRSVLNGLVSHGPRGAGKQ